MRPTRSDPPTVTRTVERAFTQVDVFTTTPYAGNPVAVVVDGSGLSTEEMQRVLAAGVSPQQVRDALAVCAAFNTTDRLADAFGFEVLSPEGFASGAKYLLKRGYR